MSRNLGRIAVSVVGTTTIVFALHAQTPPSQRELNGFLLGQHEEVLTNQFGEPMQVEKTNDGWSYRVHVVDRPHGAYMVFKFPDFKPDYIHSIQIAGDPGTNMYPFLGLRLGDDRAAVLNQIGAPSSTEAIADLGLEVFSYEGRNYSLELDSLGKLHSIQIFGYDGFPDSYPELPSIIELRAHLQNRAIDELVDMIAPDVELMTPDSVYRFSSSARLDLSDTTSTVASILYAGANSLLELLADSSMVSQASMALRQHENQEPGTRYAVWSFGEESRLHEIVYQGFVGEWRVWEVRFR